MKDFPARDVILQFSGGKDSLACLLLCRDILDRVVVAFGDTGAAFPHVREFAERTCDRLSVPLVIVQNPGSIRDYIKGMGVPADMVPVHNAVDYDFFTQGRMEPVNPWPRCCYANLWKPLNDWVIEQQPRCLIRGAKQADKRIGAQGGSVNGISLVHPLWEWSDEQVYRFIEACGFDLPPHYEHVRSSLDCYLCSAQLTFDPGRERIAYTRDRHPDLWPELKTNLETLQRVLHAEGEIIRDALADLELQPGGRERLGAP